jgi:N-glycosylase/DNA lyase
MRPQLCEVLSQFAQVPKTAWFREVLLCLLTPQSSPYHAEAAMVKLQEMGFFCGRLSESEVAEVLRTPAQYVRFHRVKASRLMRALNQRDEIEQLLSAGLGANEERDRLRGLVSGLAILDRHILRALCDCGMLEEMPSSISDRRYREIESLFLLLADKLNESPDVLDLYLWARATGSVFK